MHAIMDKFGAFLLICARLWAVCRLPSTARLHPLWRYVLSIHSSIFSSPNLYPIFIKPSPNLPQPSPGHPLPDLSSKMYL